MTLTAWIEHHRRSIIFVVLALALAGGISAVSLPVGLFPQITFPRAVVTVDAGDRPADQMALVVTQPVEQAVRRVPGVRHIRSTSSRGSAEISLDFDWGVDMVATTLQIDAAVAQVLPSLPPGTSYDVRRMDPTTFPIIAYGLTSDRVSPTALRDLAQYRIVPLLSAIPGVARVDVLGGAQQEVQVAVDPHRLDLDGLALGDVTAALGAANVLNAVGRIEDHHKLYLVVTDETLHQLDQIRSVVLKSGPAGVIRVGDVATVTDATTPAWTKVDEDGKSAVLFQVYQQPDGNSVQIAKDVRQKLAGFRMPAGIQLANWYDQSVLVTQSAGSVRDAIFIGLGLAAVVLFVFLRNWRTTLVAMLVVPATLASTVLVLSLIGQSFNIMTLGGIAAAVGLVIDDVIVMIEHIARRAGTGAGEAAVLPAGREFLRPLTGSSLATLIVFFPLGFLTGVTGAFFKALSVTMASALVISYLLTAFAVPVLARHIIDFTRWHDPAHGREPWLERQHRRLLQRIFAAPWLIAAAVVPLLALGWVAYGHVGTGFMPAMDEGGFVLDYRTLPGTSLTETDRELHQVEAILRATPEVDTFSRRTGLGLGGGLNEANQGDFFVRLKPPPRRGSDEVMADIRQRVEAQVPGVQVELAQLMEDLIGDLTAVPQPIEIQLFASDPATLIPAAKTVATAIGKVDGVVDIKDGVTLAGDALTIQVDPVKAALEGTDPAQVSSQLDAYLNGTVATNLPTAVKQVGVRVILPAGERRRDGDLAQLPIRAPDGHLFPLERVATIATDPGQPEITRDDLQRMVAVTARIENRDLGSTIQDVRQALDRPGALPAGVSYTLGGLYEQQQIAFAGLLKVFGAALVAELILLLFIYERVVLPVIIIGTSLLSTTAVFTALWLTGIELNITAMMGMTMIIGIATEMAIFYVSEYRELTQEMPPRQALLEASRNRLRPIAMTTLAAILTLMPLALGLGEGSAMQQPLAVAIIAGLILQFPMVLLVMPVLISLTNRTGPASGGTVAASPAPAE
ncbi:multidrug ABC transporter [Aliidongia dinghuensis]|uniref:Multidrug ABC transporter n=1 Tax=Aliidongia dinghuensis TaxID=1867774 RepID=A0A8J3E7U3_9PROT|nr:efflux RND transporter permease subunit [Aliidongia dinghuensis]GGF49662.1 multidrug ABC transporter [Aliidongia dinghuensis]